MKNKREKYKLSDGNLKNESTLKIIGLLLFVISGLGMTYDPQSIPFMTVEMFVYPIFAYQLVLGYQYTSNFKKYIFRIWIFALIAQVPYTLAFDTLKLNGLFTLCIALFLIDRFKHREYTWIFPALGILIFIQPEYSFYGILLPLILYLFRGKTLKALLGSIFLMMLYGFYLHDFATLFGIIGVLIALTISKYNLKIHLNKYIFYWSYPVFISIVFVIRLFN